MHDDFLVVWCGSMLGTVAAWSHSRGELLPLRDDAANVVLIEEAPPVPPPTRPPRRPVTADPKKRALLQALLEHDTVAHACAAVVVSRGAHYLWLERDDSYRQAFEVASKARLAETRQAEAHLKAEAVSSRDAARPAAVRGACCATRGG